MLVTYAVYRYDLTLGGSEATQPGVWLFSMELARPCAHDEMADRLFSSPSTEVGTAVTRTSRMEEGGRLNGSL